MKQSQKQTVNVIINSETKKRKRRTRQPYPSSRNPPTPASTSPSTTAYNPNIIGGRVPSYGLASPNPTLDSRDMTINSLINKIQAPEPTQKDYDKIIKEELNNNFTTLYDDFQKFVQENSTVLSNNNTIPSRANSVYQQEVPSTPIFKVNEVEDEALNAPKENKKYTTIFQERPMKSILKKPPGRTPKRWIELSQKEQAESRLKAVRKFLQKAEKDKNIKKIEKYRQELDKLKTTIDDFSEEDAPPLEHNQNEINELFGVRKRNIK